MTNRVANVLRVVVAVGFYLIWASQHVYLALGGNAEPYGNFFGAAYPPVYAWAWEALGEPLFPWSALLVVALEVAAGLAMLARGRTARLGQLAGLGWNLLLAPTPWGGVNLALAALHGWLATRTFERSVWSALKEGLRPWRKAHG